MNKYFVRFKITTPNTVTDISDTGKKEIPGYDFIDGDTKFIIYDKPAGLIADGYIYADTMDNGQKKSSDIINNIINLIDFSTSTSSAIPFLDMIYDASPEKKQRKIKKFFKIEDKRRNFVTINKEILTNAFKVFIANNESRIIRASNWLRKGNFEEKIVDKFVSYWTGLEAINKLLCDHFEISSKDRARICKCGEIINGLTSVGIEKLFSDILKIDNDIFHKIRKARGKLLHGGGPLDDDFIREIKDCNPIVRKALINGLGVLLDMDSEIIEKIESKIPRKYRDAIQTVYTTDIIDFYPPELEEMGKQPLIEPSVEEKQIEINENGKIIKEKKVKIECPNATLSKDIMIDTYGSENSCIKNVEIKDFKAI